MLRKGAKRGSDWEQKIPIVKALGQIGDPSALGALREILEAKSLLFRDQLKRLKEEVANTLKNYPPHNVRAVIGTI
jgi:HEAT repeat protein